MNHAHLALGLLAITSATCNAAPELLFSNSEIPALRKRLTEPVHAKIWAGIQTTAESQLNIDLAKVNEVRGNPKIQVLAHAYGRRLTGWMETLGFAYQMTGDKRFGRKGAELLTAMVRELPVDDPRVAKSFAGARGDLMRGFAIGLDWCGEAMTESERELVENRGADYIRFLLHEASQPKTWWVPHHNFMGVAMGAAGALSLKLQKRFPDEAPQWENVCAEHVEKWFGEGFDADGAYYEGALYGHYGLTNAILFANALKRLGKRDLLQHPHLRQIPQFYAMSMLPGEAVFDARNDSNYGDFSDPFLLRLAAEWNDGLARWIWDRAGKTRSPLAIIWANDVRPTAPGQTLAKHFKGRGLCVFRTGWKKSDIMFSVESGKYRAVTHNQGDKGCFTLYGLDSRWAIDSGYGNKREPQGRDQTVAHNGVLIDGKNQGLSGCGAGTDGQILTYDWNAARGYVLCDMADAYRQNNKGWKSVPVTRALRHCFFIRPQDGLPAYAVTLDDFAVDDQPHTYDWLLHTSSTNRIEFSKRGATLRPCGPSGTGHLTTPEEAEGDGACKLSFEIREAGVYSVWARVRAGGHERAKSDSFFVSMDGGERIGWHMGSGAAWHWSRVADGVPSTPRSFDLTPGRHVLRFETRERQAHLDVVAVIPGEALALDDPKTILMEAESGVVTAPMIIVPAPPAGQMPRLELVMAASTTIATSQGYYEDHPRLKITVEAVSPDFAAVLLPLPYNMPLPKIAFADTADIRTTTIRWANREDRIVWKPRTAEQPTLTQALH
ncbi:MAG: heparinase II/III family protein [Lentisphaeria bacterium]|nr:heparinase II/III family protein [Lentisphaeria bacterium]